ncbi:hypothetical protein wTpre_228 [Wolbachia endosymbiont of Trichogramma pretiosum]|nr:hypothetical protein wTpre_228 [Wolbachia endosymbiont of Trichogramma pretiosum]
MPTLSRRTLAKDIALFKSCVSSAHIIGFIILYDFIYNKSNCCILQSIFRDWSTCNALYRH